MTVRDGARRIPSAKGKLKGGISGGLARERARTFSDLSLD
jgi:hypothetical protein